MRLHRFAIASAMVFLVGAFPAAYVHAEDASQPTTIIPVQHTGANQAPEKRFEQINKRAQQGDVDLLFLGDSITQGWQSAASSKGDKGGKSVWEKYYGNRKAMNAGVGGDRTEHVLWRLDHGNIDGIHPKLAVVMIGTNNSKANKPEEIAEGIKAIVAELRGRLPDMKILLLAIFPRAEKADDPLRITNAKASELASKVADDKMVFYMDIGSKFLAPDGTLSKDIMPDLLHPNEKGYEIWAEAIEPKVAELLGEKNAEVKQ
jgi:lysophospholipase L1-like esterase